MRVPAALFAMAAMLGVSARGEPDCGVAKWTAGTVRAEYEGLTFFVTVPESCLGGGCGLILDLAGQNMSAEAEDQGTHLRRLSADAGQRDPRGRFIVLQAGGSGNPRSWRFRDPVTVYDFSGCIIDSLRVSPAAIHVGGFSQGAHVAALLYCGYPDRFASAALIAGGANIAAACLTAPRNPDQAMRSVLYIHGLQDSVIPPRQAEGLLASFASTFRDALKIDAITGSEKIYSAPGALLDVILHNFSGGFAGGHCMPGGEGPVGCEADFDAGKTILNFYIEHLRATLHEARARP